MLSILNISEVVSFRVMMRLVVPTRLQAQHSSFRLRTSRDRPFVPTNVAHVSFCKF
jgi:hypothetical protein